MMLWRLWTLLLAACLPFAPLFAQDSEQVSESSVVGNSVEERTPEALLDEWEARHQQRELVEAQVLLREYHNIFAVEKLGYGRCSWRGPDEWHIELEPSSVTAAAQEARQQPGTPVRRKHGQPYQLAGIDQPFSLACDGDTVELKWGDENRAYPDRARRMNRLEDESAEFGPFEGLFHEWMIPDVCPPWLFVFRPDRIRSFCQVEEIRVVPGRPDQVRLTFVPLEPWQATAWKSSEVILDTQAYRPLHIRVFRPSSTVEKVYSFQEWTEVPRGKGSAGMSSGAQGRHG